MADSSDSSRPSETVRERLLDAAERIFAERSFAEASVRDITTAADCNLASVNYYFSSKEKLYTEMFLRLIVRMREQRTEMIHKVMAREDVVLEDILQGFAEVFLEPLLDKDHGGSSGMELLMREFSDTHLLPEMFYSEMILPTRQMMSSAIMQLEPGIDEVSALFCIHSLVGQLTHVAAGVKFMSGVAETYNIFLDVPEIINHIVRFTAGGIRACAERDKQQ